MKPSRGNRALGAGLITLAIAGCAGPANYGLRTVRAAVPGAKPWTDLKSLVATTPESWEPSSAPKH